MIQQLFYILHRGVKLHPSANVWIPHSGKRRVPTAVLRPSTTKKKGAHKRFFFFFHPCHLYVWERRSERVSPGSPSAGSSLMQVEDIVSEKAAEHLLHISINAQQPQELQLLCTAGRALAV